MECWQGVLVGVVGVVGWGGVVGVFVWMRFVMSGVMGGCAGDRVVVLDACGVIGLLIGLCLCFRFGWGGF